MAENRNVETTKVRLWALDPLFRCNLKLFICQMLSLPEVSGFEGVYLLFDHHVTRFEVLGCIVSVDKKEKFVKYRIDDGTGVIDLCLWLNNYYDPSVLTFELGQLVSASGKMTTFRDERQLNIDQITLEDDANAEPFHWLEIIRYQDIYKKEVILPEELVNFPTF